MPLFVEQRALYEARERPSKAYSWVAFLLAQVLVEIPWQILCAVFSFVSWYYPIGLYRNAMAAHQTSERGGLMFLFLLQFMLFTSTVSGFRLSTFYVLLNRLPQFSQMLVAGSDTAEAAGNAGNLVFSLTLLFCGVLAGPKTLGWWVSIRTSRREFHLSLLYPDMDVPGIALQLPCGWYVGDRRRQHRCRMFGH